jgi:hypothetical protein
LGIELHGRGIGRHGGLVLTALQVDLPGPEQ